MIIYICCFLRLGFVEEFADLGASVYTCSRNGQELNQLLEEWKAKGFDVTGSVCDVYSRAEREQLFQRVSLCYGGKLHVLVCSLPLTFASNIWVMFGYKLYISSISCNHI